VGSAASPDDLFGVAVALTGDTAVVGAPGDNIENFGPGMAYVFRRDGDTWVEQALLQDPDGAERDGFGGAVALAGDAAVVGAPGHEETGDAGKARVFVRSGGAWTLQATLRHGAPEVNDRFGAAVGLAGSTAVVGAPGDDLADAVDAGSATVYDLHLGGTFHTLRPCRVLDTRSTGALSSGAVGLVATHGRCGIPPTARQLAVNVTVTSPTGRGHVNLVPGGTAPPPTSVLNFGPGQTRANSAIVGVDDAGVLAVQGIVAGGGSVQVIVDVSGYFL
jgi:hypothetical protein